MVNNSSLALEEFQSSGVAYPVTMDLSKDEVQVMAIYRKAKRMGYADIEISIAEGDRKKLWLTEKIR